MTYEEKDPEQQLEDAKRAIQSRIAATKNLIANAKKELRDTQKLPLEHHQDKPDRIKAIESKLENLQNTLFDLEADYKDLNRTRDDETEEKIQAALHHVRTEIIDKDASVAYIIKDKEFITITENSTVRHKQNVTIDKYDVSSFIQLLAAKTKLKSWHLPSHRVIDLFNSCDRSYKMVRFTIDSPRWNKDVYQPISLLRDYFVDKMELTPEEDEYATSNLHYFDWLMYSLSGGKDENKEHIERWIIQKIINYDKAVTTPDLVIVGHVGGNGKGILQAMMRIMLPAILSGNANTKTLTNNFNAIMLGKLVVFFDDQISKEIPLDVVKQLAGSDTMIFEEKGKDQYNGEKTHSSAWFSQQLPFRLTPAGQEGGVDRRFSVMRTNITFLESIRIFMYKQTGEFISVEDSKDFAEAIVTNVLLNRICIAKWVQHLKKKYSDIDKSYVLKALHGEDYRYFLEQQTDKLQEIFEELIEPVVKQGGAVPMFVIREVLRLNNEAVPHDKTLYKKINELASQHNVDIKISRCRTKIVNQDGSHVKKQGSAITAKNNTDSSPEFEWSLVSKSDFVPPGKGQDYITEEDFILGVKNASDDQDDIIDPLEEVKIESVIDKSPVLSRIMEKVNKLKE